MHFTLCETVYILYPFPFKYYNYVALIAFYCCTISYFPCAKVKLQKTSFLLYGILMNCGQSGSSCGMILAEIAYDNTIVLNANYVLKRRNNVSEPLAYYVH